MTSTKGLKMKDEFLFENDVLSLKQLDGWYNYGHMSRTEPDFEGSGQGVAVLVYTMKDGKVDKILGRYENCLPHRSEAKELTSITGGVDKGKDIEESMLTELNEEAGYDTVVPESIEYLDTCRPSKQEDSVWHLYAFDATGLERREESIGDGTEGEEGAFCEWVDPHVALNCKCPLVPTMMVRAGLMDKL